MFGRYAHRGSISSYRTVRDVQGRVNESQRRSQRWELLAVCQVVSAIRWQWWKKNASENNDERGGKRIRAF